MFRNFIDKKLFLINKKKVLKKRKSSFQFLFQIIKNVLDENKI